MSLLILCIAMSETYLHDVPLYLSVSFYLFGELRQGCLVWMWFCRREWEWRCCSQGSRSASTPQLLGQGDQFGWLICKFRRGLAA